MTNQLIISEINRISNLMYNTSINESFLKTKALDEFLQVFTGNNKLLNKVASELGVTVDKLSDDISKITNNTELAEFINKTAVGSAIFKKEISNILMSNLSDDVAKGIKDIKLTIIDEIKKDKTLSLSDVERLADDFVDDQIKTEYSIVRTQIKDDLKAELRNEFSAIRGSAPPIKTPVGKIQQVGKGWYDSIKACGLTPVEIATVSKVMPLRKLRGISGAIIKNITSISDDLEIKALETCFGNLKLYVNKLEESGINDVDLLKNANLILIGLKKDKRALINNFRDEVINTIKRAEGPNGERVSAATIEKLRTGLNANNPLDINQPSWIRDVIQDYTPEVVKKFTKLDKMKFDSKFYTFMDGVFGILTTGTLRTIDEACTKIMELGVRKAVGKMYTMAQIVSKVLVPLGFGILYWATDMIAASIGLAPAMDWWDRFKKDVINPLYQKFKTKFKELNLMWLINPFNFHWDELGTLIGTGLQKASTGALKWLKDKVMELFNKTVSETNRVIEDRTGRSTSPTDSTTTTTPTDTTTTTPPPSLTSDIQNFDSRWLNVATFTKVNENTYKMKFTTDQNKLSSNEIPSDWAGKETVAKKTNNGWVFTLGDQGPFPLGQ